MRLLRQELGEKGFARESAMLRDAGLRLAGARDAGVTVRTLDQLIERNRKELGSPARRQEAAPQLASERGLGRGARVR